MVNKPPAPPPPPPELVPAPPPPPAITRYSTDAVPLVEPLANTTPSVLVSTLDIVVGRSIRSGVVTFVIAIVYVVYVPFP